jgi:predicted dehydrogenase
MKRTFGSLPYQIASPPNRKLILIWYHFAVSFDPMKYFTAILAFYFVALTPSAAQTVPSAPPLRVAIAGLVHGHIEGFFQNSLHRPDIEVVGIAESDKNVVSRYTAQFGLDPAIIFPDLETLLQKTHPQAVLAYTNTFDHRRVVEICARHGIPVMMEKPLAVSAEDAHAIEYAARQAKIQVLVNYPTTWYRSNHAAYDLAHQQAIGEIRKIVVQSGHQGPKEIGVQPEFLAWLTDPKLAGGGALFDFGCYGANLATWLMNGRRPITVTAVTQQLKPDIYPRVEDDATIILTYPKVQVVIQASWNWPFDRGDLEVFGQTGYVKTAGHNDVLMRLQNKDEQQAAAQPLPPAYDDPLSYLRAVVLGGRTPDGPSSLETNVIVSEILDAARRSAASGQTIRLAGGPARAISDH